MRSCELIELLEQWWLQGSCVIERPASACLQLTMGKSLELPNLLVCGTIKQPSTSRWPVYVRGFMHIYIYWNMYIKQLRDLLFRYIGRFSTYMHIYTHIQTQMYIYERKERERELLGGASIYNIRHMCIYIYIWLYAYMYINIKPVRGLYVYKKIYIFIYA